MNKSNLRPDRITYRRLDAALTSLGFVRKDTPEFTAYRNADYDALIVLPVFTAETLVSDPHFVGLRNTIVGKGAATEEQLYALLKPTAVKTKNAAKQEPSLSSRT